MNRPHHLNGRTLLVLFTMMVALIAAGALAADPPVTVAIGVTGTAVPGATVSAKATVTINDGSSLQSIQWKQVSGATAQISGATTNTITVTLPDRKAYREELALVLEEPPATADVLPPSVPYPAGYEGGLANRFGVAAVSPHALAEAGAIGFDITVVTSSGTYHSKNSIATTIPWTEATGIRNVPTLLPVVLHGKNQTSYNWTLTPPAGSKSVLTDATTQNPEFTPDMAGKYTVKVTDLADNSEKTMVVYAGTWRGIITGQDESGAPIVDTACTTCHVPNTPNFDMFTPWKKSGHAQIFSQNVSVAGHYSQSCLSCHSVGFNKDVKNGGMDDAPDFEALAASGLIEHGATDNWNQILTQYPASAKLANIQCENCHGPQDSAAHTARDGSRQNLSSDICGSCHGEPARHGRFQQWQLSGHANLETAISEGTNPSCAKCHSAQGFVQWANSGFGSGAITVDWTEDTVQAQTCATCHDPHFVGTTSGLAANDASVRVSGTTPMLDAGFQ
ncbi:MAG: hypothetical protein WBX15_15055, partial [Thermoanaerobaculia bacterium]